MAVSAGSATLTQRIMGALRLDVATYEEVEADTSATSQALTVVVLASVLTGIGSAIGAAMTPEGTGNPIGALIGGLISTLIAWAVWSWVVFFVGTRMFGGTATYGELLRTLGFGYAPSMFGVLTFIPVAGGLIGLAVAIWGLATGFVAARQALDISNGKTVAVIIVAFIALVIVVAILAAIFAAIGFGGAMMLGGLTS